MRLRLAFVACALCLTARPRSGHAEEAREVRLRYAAPAECPTADDFAAEVRARTALARISAGAGAGADTTLDVQIKNVEGGSAGTMRLYTGGGATTPREVKAATCVQVVSALALMAALAIDPEASTEPSPEPKVEPKPAPPPPPPVAPRRPVSRGAPARLRWRAGVALEALGGVTPDLVLAVRPFFEMVHEGSAWGFAARLSGARARGTARIAEGAGDFTLWALRLEGCPLHYRPWTPLWLSSCLTLDGGKIDAAGTDVTPAAEVGRAWFVGGALARLEIRLFDLLSLELGGGVLFPFVRDRFYLGTGATLHRTPAVAGAGAIGLGALFP